MTEQVTAEVRASERIGAFQHVTLAAPGVVATFRPGNFVSVALGSPDGGASHLLRRSFWVHRVRSSSSHGATIDVVVRPGGVGSRWLAGLAVGAPVDLIGPLGRPFAQPKEPVACLLVGEGYAAGSLFPLAERLVERGCPVSLLLAGDTADDVIDGLDVRRSAQAVTIVTADGSMGAQGTVAQALPGALQRSGASVVYAAGPTATLHAVAGIAEQHGAWSQVALEVPQPCGTGLCHGCIVPAVGEDAIAHRVRACAEGPVFRGDRIQWGVAVSPDQLDHRPGRRIYVASGCGGTGRELAPYSDLTALGGFVTRTFTLDPRRGSRLRLVESAGGLVRAHQVQNPGIDRFLTNELPWLAKHAVRTWVSVTGADPSEIAAVVRRVASAPGLSGIELDLSVDDPRALRLHDGSTPRGAVAAVEAVLGVLPDNLALHVKLGADVHRLPTIARAVAEVGADALVVGGALPAALDNGTPAELSGPAVLPVALRAVRAVRAELSEFPLIGVGGVATAADVRAFEAAGAAAVQVGSALLRDPSTLTRLSADLEEPS